MGKQVEQLLAPEKSLWKLAVGAVFGTWGLRTLGIPENWQEGASLDYVYDDDQANLPIHYMAYGSPISMCVAHPSVRVLKSPCHTSPSPALCFSWSFHESCQGSFLLLHWSSLWSHSGSFLLLPWVLP
jgi:hypothetical protein